MKYNKASNPVTKMQDTPIHLIRKDGKPRATRLPPEVRKAQIIEQGVLLANEIGFKEITRNEIAARTGVSFGLVNRYFKSFNKLKTAIRKQMKEQQCSKPQSKASLPSQQS